MKTLIKSSFLGFLVAFAIQGCPVCLSKPKNKTSIAFFEASNPKKGLDPSKEALIRKFETSIIQKTTIQSIK